MHKTETTINIHKEILKQLNYAAEKTGKSRSQIIMLICKKMMADEEKLEINRRVRNQTRDNKENWHRLHIVVYGYEYEYLLDMKKMFKVSVSFIVATAVIQYLAELLHELIEQKISTDNYGFFAYCLFRYEGDNGAIRYEIY